MKKIKILLAVAFMGMLSYGTYSAYDSMSSNTSNQLLLENVEALASGEGIPASYADCLAKGGNWNMASVCAEGGFYDSECTVSGEISAFGIILKGSYTKGNSYHIPYARYNCVNSSGNCCIKQGLYTGETKLA